MNKKSSKKGKKSEMPAGAARAVLAVWESSAGELDVRVRVRRRGLAGIWPWAVFVYVLKIRKQRES